MTDFDPRTAPAGPELDAWLMEHVLGWTPPDYRCWHNEMGDCCLSIRPTTDANDALKVLEKIGRDVCNDIFVVYRPDIPDRAWHIYPRPLGAIGAYVAPTFCMAIARLAVAVVETREESDAT